jgi:hypothetical protein
MSCTAFDVRDYFLGELPEPERLQAARHIQGCENCASEFEQLTVMRAALSTLREEEPPQRIGFVSDKVFEPSPVRRWLGSFWLSGARLGFASAAMLALAVAYSASHRPAEKVVVETRTVAAAQPDIQGIVSKAVADAEARQEKKTQALLAAAEVKHKVEQQALSAQLAVSFDMIEKRRRVLRASALEFAGDPR